MSARFSLRRHRWVAGVVVVAAACGAGLAIAGTGADAAPREIVAAAPLEAVHTQPITATGTAPFVAPGITAGLAPGAAILTSTVTSLSVFDQPAGVVTRELGRYTRYSLPLTLMAIDSAEVDGASWYQVSLPAKPNGQTGWVRASDVSVSSTHTVVHVYLEERQLDVVVNGSVSMTAPVAVGAAATPTPLGTFYITDPIDLTAHPSAVYGTYALGLSGYSEALDSFKGTLPQIAIHGTNAPNMIGQAVSNGCIRMKNDAVVDVAARVGLGTPVIVSASRTAP